MPVSADFGRLGSGIELIWLFDEVCPCASNLFGTTEMLIIPTAT
jgi:hypothetical protein